MRMSAQATRWARRYEMALRNHLRREPDPATMLRVTQRLGREAVELGMETLDLAKTHERALTTLVLTHGSPATRRRRFERARRFFIETIVPIEKTHRAARKADIRVGQLTRTLRRRTAESFASTRRLSRGVLRRHAAEKSMAANGIERKRLLTESHRLQRHLRGLTREILSAQEAERLKTSHQIHDEIAQTLIAIDLRLLTLKNAVWASAKGLKKEIANTQRLVKQSTTKLNRFVHEFGTRHKT